MIYSYVVYYPKGLVRHEIHEKHSNQIQSWLVNREFYHEFSALFYRLNTFKFHSGYVRTGDDPFGPRLDRIERCYLHLAMTRQSSNAFLKWFVDEFAAAVALAENLKYLIVRMAEHQKDCVQSLEPLSGIQFAQVQVGRVYRYPRNVRGRGPRGGLIYFSGQEKTGYEQRLERLLMNDGRPEKDVLAGLGHTYVSEPPLSTDLTGEALEEAQRRGGWADDYHLFDFLGITLKTGMTEELNYTTP
ncbi:MAG: hypothetical protein L6R38_001939 [Xanthoria sp. 2 TBL-2021]|nr:MAG: hypothetical protein L6R38_001939 [Xanthoria sp. 2 TBL-2021]